VVNITERIQVYRAGIEQVARLHGLEIVTMALGRQGQLAFWRFGVRDEAQMMWGVTVQVPSHFELDFEVVVERILAQIWFRSLAIVREAELAEKERLSRETLH
jgi:hypothetical protein